MDTREDSNEKNRLQKDTRPNGADDESNLVDPTVDFELVGHDATVDLYQQQRDERTRTITEAEGKQRDQQSLTVDLTKPFGRYRLLRSLGKGGMGEVFLAEDTELRRLVAIKLPLKRDVSSPESHERFLREARSAAALDHRAICPLYDFGEIADQPFMAMAYVEGVTLASRLKAKPSITIFEAVQLAIQLAKALDYAHRMGVIHRDIKPQNVIIDGAGNPNILDFGLARINQPDEVELTQSGVILGTPAYMSPEQAEGKTRAIGPATDIYSLGVMLYEMIAGVRPFQGTPTEVIGMHLFVEPIKPSRHNKSVDLKLESICMRMLAKDPTERFQSMAEIVKTLEQWSQARQELGLMSPGNEKLGWWIPVAMIIASLGMLYFAWFFSLDNKQDAIDWGINLLFTAPCVLVSLAMFVLAIWWIVRSFQLSRRL